uniref:DNA sequence from clone AEHM-21P16 n=1 Tax=Heliconius melpomene TaxID=34740 RepID=C3PPG9_HELME|nr:unnamed protein product [Heliconius melpomene]CAY54177.1 unnamed protein product [Heliconius melpomene]
MIVRYEYMYSSYIHDDVSTTMLVNTVHCNSPLVDICNYIIIGIITASKNP